LDEELVSFDNRRTPGLDANVLVAIKILSLFLLFDLSVRWISLQNAFLNAFRVSFHIVDLVFIEPFILVLVFDQRLFNISIHVFFDVFVENVKFRKYFDASASIEKCGFDDPKVLAFRVNEVFV
jgi:hypothetical protein